MTTIEQDSKITLEGNQVIVRDFATSDYDIVSYFENLSQSEDIEQKLENLLKIGITVTKSIEVSNNVSYIDKAFENLDEKMKQKLEHAFGAEGQFAGLLKGHFGKDGILLKELFDPSRDGSPLYLLRRDLEKNLDEIREKLGINAAIEEEADRGTKKGADFEKLCQEKLVSIAKNHTDKLEHTGDIRGNLSKKGDFVMTLGDTGKRIVFEMKNQATISLLEIQKEMDEAIENRSADYGIFVAKNKDSLPGEVGWFAEYDGKHLVCAVQNYNEDSLIDVEIIDIAYKWARARLRLESSNTGKLEPSFILDKTKVIQNKLAEFRKIKIQCTSIENSAKTIKDTIEDMKTAIQVELDEIIQSLDTKK